MTANLTIVDNNLLDGPQSVTLTASVPNWTSGSATLTVNDNELATLAVAAPASFTEGQGIVAGAGTVTIGGVAVAPVTVSLSSSATGRLTVPATVTIAAGQSSATFAITIVDNTATDGAQAVTITASAASFPNATANTVVHDNDVATFTFATIGAQTAAQSFPVTITARTVDGEQVAGFAGSVTLSVSGAGGVSPAATGNFTGGSWTGNITVLGAGTGVTVTASDASGHAGASGAFAVAVAPVHHFVLSSVSSPQVVNSPFMFTITAKDQLNATTPYAGAARLMELPASSPAATGTGGQTTTTPLAVQSNYAGRSEVLLTADQIGGPQLITGLSLFFVATPQPISQWTIRVKPTTQTAFPATGATWDSAGWITVYSGPLNVTTTGWTPFAFTTPVFYGGHDGLMVDFVFQSNYPPTRNASFSARTMANPRVLTATTLTAGVDPKTWTGTAGTPAVSALMPDVRLTSRVPTGASPPTVTGFVNGVWTGPVRVNQAANPTALLAWDPATDAYAVSNDFTATASSSLTLSLSSANITEGGAPVTGTVSIPAALGSALTVSLTSDHPADITMPATVTIPAGSKTATFSISAPNDGLLEGHEIARIEAYAVNYNSGLANLDIADSETTGILVTLPANLTEGTSGTGTVAVGKVAANDLTITLDADLTTELTVPASMIIPAGQTSASFPITAVNDNVIDGTKTVTVNAHLAGIANGSATMQVLDAAPLTLALTVPSPKREGDPVFNGAVTLSSPTAADRVIALASSDTTVATVPANVTVPAGQSSAVFPITIVDNTATDGTRTATIAASAANFSNGSAVLTVQDNDAHHFAISAVGATQIANQPFTISVTAKDVSDATITSNFAGPVTLTASAGGAPVTMTPITSGTFISGVWTGSVSVTGFGTGVTITASDGAGHSGTSNVFDVTTGALDHFGISAIASPQDASVPFSVTVTALDAANNVLSNFAGPVSLAANVAGTGVEVITGAGTVTSSWPLYTGWHDCRTQSIYTPAEAGAARLLTGLALNVTTVPGQLMNTFTIRLKHTTKADYTGTGNAAWDGTGWTTVYQANQTISATGWVPFAFTTPFSYNGSDNLMVDVSFNNSSYTSSGATTYTSSSTTRTIYYYTDSSYGDPLTWSGTTSPSPYTTTSLPNLKLLSAPPLAMTPAVTGTFANGEWTGNVAINEAAASALLTAVGSGKSGFSNAFAIGSSAGTLKLNLSTQVATEGDVPISATLSRTGSVAADLAVTLASSRTSEATVPATVTIPAGSTSVNFPVTIVDDVLLDGTQTTVISADAPGYARVSQTLTVNDNETATLSVALPATLTEGTTPSGPGTVTISAAADAPITVSLASSLPARLTVPATVTIPAGATSATFPITLISNTTLDFSAVVSVTASVPGFVSGTGTTTLYDDEANLTVSLTSSTTEGAAPFTGTVSVATAPASPVTVSISSSNPAKAAVVSSVTIPAGSTSAMFTVAPQDNAVKDGQQIVTLSFSAFGYTPKTASLTVNDNELDHYTFTTTVPSTVVRNAATSITITAKDINGVTIPTFSGTVNLSAAGGAGPVAMTPATATLSGGTATVSAVFTQADSNVIVTASDVQGVTGATNTFDVIALGPFAKFLWSAMSSKQTEVPFPVTLTAADAGGNTITSYTGPASLNAYATGTDVTIGTGTSFSSSFPLPNTFNSRMQSIYLASEVGAAKRLTNLQLYLTIPSTSTFSNFTVRLKHTTKANYNSGGTWDSTGWTTVYAAARSFATSGWNTITFTTPFDYDGASNLMVDLSFNNTSFPNSGSCNYSTASSYRTLYYSTTTTAFGVPTTWSGTSPFGSTTTALTNVRFGNLTVFTMSPTATGAFTSGAWTGNVTVRDPGASVSLSATDVGAGVSSNSSTFAVTSTGNLGLTVVSLKREGDGVVANAGTVTLPSAAASSVTVSLTSSDTSAATVPASVTVPAGQTSVSFPITIIDNALIDGDRVTVIEASATGYTRKTASLTVQDNDGGVLTLALPVEVIESGGSGTGTVTVSITSANARTITLASNNTAVITVPASVTIPAGQTSASFTFTVINDYVVNGSRTVGITASAPGWTSGTANVIVQDDDVSALTLSSFFGTLSEGGTASVYVYLPNGLTGPVTVNVGSSDPFTANAPSSVTISSGSTFALITIPLPENTATDGAHTAFITMNATGFTGATAALTVADNDLHHYTVSAISSPQIAGAPITVTIQAVTFDGTPLTTALPALTLTASAGGTPVTITPTATGALSSGSWSGTVTIPGVANGVTITATDANGRSGTSNAFNTGTGPFAKFAWSAISSPQTVAVPFAASVRATDIGGNTVAGYNGTPSLRAYVGTTSVTTGTGTYTSSYPLASYSSVARTQYIYTPAEVGAARTLISLAMNVTSVPGQVLNNFTIRLKHTTKVDYSATGSATWEGTGWTTVYQANQTISATGWNTFYFTTPFAYDGASNLMVDISFSNTTSSSAGAVSSGFISPYRMLYYSGGSSNGDPLTWSGASSPTPYTDYYLANLKFDSGTSLSVSPAVLSFTNGVWNGNVSVGAAGTGVLLEVMDASAGVVGDSNAFDVQYLGTLTLSVPATAREGDAPVTGTLSVSPTPSSDFTVNLTSSDTTAAIVPASVTIPAGQSGVTFPIVIVNDTLFDGPQPALITATRTSYATATATITVNDNQSATVGISMPASVTEGQGTLANAGTVTLSRAPARDIAVSLTASDPASLAVPATITIAAGTMSKSFDVTVVDDTAVNGTRAITVTAHVSGWTDAIAVTVVNDNESAADWPTFGNGPSHTGYQPITLGTLSFTAGWTLAYPTSTGGINQVAVGGGKVFVTPNNRFADTFVSAVDAATGTQAWRYTFSANANNINAPTFQNGGVYVQHGNSVTPGSDAALVRFSATTGAVGWSAPFGAQWENYFAPAVFVNSVWVDGGTYGGLYGFGTTDGSQQFFNSSLEQYDQWTPTYYSGTLYTWIAGKFRAHNPTTGQIQWTLDLGWSWNGWSMNTAAAIDQGRAFVVGSPNFYAIDLTTRTSPWSATGTFKGSPAVAGNAVYVLTAGNVNAYNVQTGALLGSFATGDTAIAGQPIVTNDSLIVSSSTATYIFNRTTFALKQTLPAGGAASLAGNTIYLAGADGVLRTYTRAVSSNANLSALALSVGALSPVFASGTTIYSASVGNATGSITVTPFLADATATVKVNGVNATSGNPSGAIGLNVGTNIITVSVTAQDGFTVKLYTITVTRRSAYADWALIKGISGPNAGPNDDFDGDGISNMTEWAFGTNPANGGAGTAPLRFNGTFSSGGTIAATGQPIMMSESSANGTDIRALYVRRKDAASVGLSYSVEFSSAFSAWSVNATAPTVLADDGTWQIVSVPFPSLANGDKACFFRVKVTQSP